MEMQNIEAKLPRYKGVKWDGTDEAWNALQSIYPEYEDAYVWVERNLDQISLCYAYGPNVPLPQGWWVFTDGSIWDPQSFETGFEVI